MSSPSRTAAASRIRIAIRRIVIRHEAGARTRPAALGFPILIAAGPAPGLYDRVMTGYTVAIVR